MAQYRITEMPDLHHTGQKKFYPRLVLAEQLGTNEIAARIAGATAFTPGDVKGLLTALADEVARGMAEGRSVKLEGLGIFSLALGFTGDDAAAASEGSVQVNARKVGVRAINVRPDKRLVESAARALTLTRGDDRDRLAPSPYTPAQRLALAQEEIAKNRFLQIARYRELTGLGSTAAATELRAFAADPATGIAAMGGRGHRLYVAREKETAAQ